MGVCAFGGDKTSLSCLLKSISLKLELIQALFNTTGTLIQFYHLGQASEYCLKKREWLHCFDLKELGSTLVACPARFERATYALEGRCSIQLSYRQCVLGLKTNTKRKWSEYKDSNLGPPAPKAGALPGCATLRRNRYSTPR